MAATLQFKNLRSSISIFLICLIVSSCANFDAQPKSVTTQERRVIIQKLIDKNDLMGVFEKASALSDDNSENGVLIVSSAFNDYISACCKTKKDIIDALKSEGFKVKTHPRKYTAHNYAGVDYDEVIGAGKTKATKHIYVTRFYDASIYLKDDVVVKIYARTNLDTF